MNYYNRKRKKLSLVVKQLKNLNLKNPDLQNDIENLINKNQLEIEKRY